MGAALEAEFELATCTAPFLELPQADKQKMADAINRVADRTRKVRIFTLHRQTLGRKSALPAPSPGIKDTPPLPLTQQRSGCSGHDACQSRILNKFFVFSWLGKSFNPLGEMSGSNNSSCEVEITEATRVKVERRSVQRYKFNVPNEASPQTDEACRVRLRLRTRKRVG